MPRAQLALYSLLPMIVPNSNAVRVLKRRKFKLLVKSSFLTAPHTPQDDDFTASSLDLLLGPSEAAKLDGGEIKMSLCVERAGCFLGNWKKKEKIGDLEMLFCVILWSFH